MTTLGVWDADSAFYGKRQGKFLSRIRSFRFRVVVTMLSNRVRYPYFPLGGFGIYVLESCASQPRQREHDVEALDWSDQTVAKFVEARRLPFRYSV